MLISTFQHGIIWLILVTVHVTLIGLIILPLDVGGSGVHTPFSENGRTILGTCHYLVGGGALFWGEGHNFFSSCLGEGHKFFQGFLG